MTVSTLAPLSSLRRLAPLAFIAGAIAVAGCTIPGQRLAVQADNNSNPGGAESSDIYDRADIYAINAQLVKTMVVESKARADANAKALMAALPQSSDTYRYQLAPQDVLRVTVWDHPEITNPTNTANEFSGRTINSDGTFFFPFIGKVQAAGKTVEQVRDALASGLKSYIRDPQIDVAVLQFRSQRYVVSGQVGTPGMTPSQGVGPGVQTLTDVPIRVLDAISAAGGLGPEADLPNVTLTRAGKSYKLDLYRLYYEGDMSQNIYVQAGDVINVGERRFSKVFVMGEVNTPASMPMPRGRLTLAEALADAGGVNPLTSNAGQIYVIRGDETKTKTQIYHLNASSPDALILADKFDLRARDVVFVDAAGIARFGRVVNNVLPSALLLQSLIQNNN
ncbi:polysaccharide biosynthesis/export family protein [soil metagenome]